MKANSAGEKSLIGFEKEVSPVSIENRTVEDSIIDIIVAKREKITIRDKQPTKVVSINNNISTDTKIATDTTTVSEIAKIDVAESNVRVLTSTVNSKEIVNNNLVIIGTDTVSAVLNENLWGRYDRGMKNYLFMPKGKWIFGMTASYGNITVDGIEVLSLLSGLEVGGSIFSIHPEVSYAIGNNRVVGMRMSYAETDFDLRGLDLNLMDDMSFSLSDVIYNQRDYSAAVFYRYYIGLDRAHRFSLFNEVDLTFLSGNGVFGRSYDGEQRVTNTNMAKVSLNYSPGLSVFIQEYVSFNVSFGIFGLYYLNEIQTMDAVETGSRTASGASFQFNLFNIKFGIAVHI
ncbi:MAG: hypothetical protein R3Y22_02450 [Bacteroidales bacterium]